MALLGNSHSYRKIINYRTVMNSPYSLLFFQANPCYSLQNETFKEETMQEVTIKLNEELKTINVSLVFASKNPQTNQTNVNLSYSEKDEQKWLQLFCAEEEIETLIPGIREGKITDLSQYVIQEVD